jgi:hypothetical protein
VGISGYWWYNIQNIRNDVLNQLKGRLKFCEIVRDDINIFSKSGKFWLICNGRPFYAEYLNNVVSYELNGWSWLKETQYWNELKGCDFYDFRNSELIFYCPKRSETYPYPWINVSEKIYNFAYEKFSLKKVGENDFINTIIKDMKNAYPIFEDCKITKLEARGGAGYSPVILFSVDCKDFTYLIETNLLTLSFPMPKVNAREAFKSAFPEVKSIETKNGTILAEFAGFTLTLSNWTMKIGLKDSIESVIGEINFLIFPKPKGLRELTQVLKEKYVAEALPAEFVGLEKIYYKINGLVIRVYGTKDNIFGIERVGEGFYEA